MEEHTKELPAVSVTQEITQSLLQRDVPDFLRKRHKETLKGSLKEFMATMGAKEENYFGISFSCLPEVSPFKKEDLDSLFRDPKKEIPFFAQFNLGNNRFALKILDADANGPYIEAKLNFRTRTPSLKWTIWPPDMGTPKVDKQFKNTELNRKVLEAPDSKESIEFFGRLLSFVAQHSLAPQHLRA